MTKQNINIGVEGNDATGDAIRDAFRKVNENFNELYSIAGSGDGIPFTSLSDYDPQRDQAHIPETLLYTGTDGYIHAKKLVAGESIVINRDYTDPATGEEAILIGSTGGRLVYDLHPQLGGHLDGQGSFFIGNILDPDHASANNAAASIGLQNTDTFAITKGYANTHFVNADGDTMSGHLNVPANALGSQAPQKQEVVGRLGGGDNQMLGPLLLDADPVPSSDPLTAVTKRYVDVNSYPSDVNFFVSTNGRTAFQMQQDDVQTNNIGRAYAYAFSSLNEACKYAEDVIHASTLEPGNYKQPITINSGAELSVVHSVTDIVVSGVSLTRLAITNFNSGAGTVDQGNSTNTDLNTGKLIIGSYSGAVGTIYTYRGVQGGYDEIDIKMISGTFQITEQLYYDNPTPKIQVTINVESGIYEEHLPIRVPRNVSIIGDEMRRTIIRPKDDASSSPWVSLYFYRDPTIDGLTTTSTGYGYHYLKDPTREINLGPTYTNAGGYAGAGGLLSSNKEFIQAEVTAYMVEAFPSIMFDTASLNLSSRDIGLIVDALVSDLNDSGNSATINAASRYYGSTIGSSYKAACEDALNYMNTILDLILNLTALPVSGTVRKRSLLDQNMTGGAETGSIATTADLMSSIIFAFDTDFNPPKNNKEIDLFLMNDATGLKDFTMQGHGGFAVVLDPEGQILTKSPYIQNCSSIAASINKKAFRGGAFIDGFCGRMPVTITSALDTNGVSEISISGLTFPKVRPLDGEDYRKPNTPTSFWVNGQRFRIEKIVSYDDSAHTATLTLGDSYTFLNSEIVLETAGNRSMLATHFTQVNDLGYGVIATNNALIELVSVFTYYCHTAYYSLNGGQIRSVSGSNSNGFFGLKAEGSDPGEVPRSAILSDNITQIAKVYKQGSKFAGAGYNAAGGSYITVTDFEFLPYSDSELQIMHTDPQTGGQLLTRYSVTNTTPTMNKNFIWYVQRGGNGVAIVQTKSAHGLLENDSVTISGVPYSEFNGVKTVTAVGPNYQSAIATYQSSGGNGAINTDIFDVKNTLNNPTILTISNNNFVKGNIYIVAATGTTTQNDWNTIGGTTGQPYSAGTVFTAAASGAGNGSGTAYLSPFQIGQAVSGTGIPTTNLLGQTISVFVQAITNLTYSSGQVSARITLSNNFTVQAAGDYNFVAPTAGTIFYFTINQAGFVNKTDVSSSVPSPIVILNKKIAELSLGTGIGGASTLKDNLKHADYVVIRSTLNFKLYGNFGDISSRPSTSMDLVYDGDGTGTYRTVDFGTNYYNNSLNPTDIGYLDASPLGSISGLGDGKIITIDSNYENVQCQLTGIDGTGGLTELRINSLTAADQVRVIGMEFGWVDQDNNTQKGYKRQITAYSQQPSYATITLDSALPTGTFIPANTTLFATIRKSAITTIAATHAISSSDVMTGSGVIYLASGTGVNFTNNGTYARYVRIDDEFFSYTSVVGDELRGVTRRVLGSVNTNHIVGATVYELGALLTANISTCRTTSHDFLNIGTGGYNTSNFPNNLFGSPKESKVTPAQSLDDKGLNTKAEVQEKNKGRVFFAATNQDGFFRVGRFFSVDQGTGSVELKATLALSNISGLGFKTGVVIKEFSNVGSMPDSSSSVPTNSAVREFVSRRLGLNVDGTIVDSAALIGPGFMPRDGSLAASNTMDLGGNRIANVSQPSQPSDAANKTYVDYFLRRSGGTRTGVDMFIMNSSGTSVTAYSAARDGSNVATIVTATAHGLSVGSVVTVSGVNGGDVGQTLTDFDAVGVTVTSVPSSTSFTYANTGATKSITQVYGAVVTVPSNIGMNNNKITNIATPTDDKDVTNKLYVDTKGNIQNLGDVTITSAGNHQLFAYNGSNWVNASLTGDITVSLSGNTLTSAIGAGKITNTMVSASAAIAQSKLSMGLAPTVGVAPSGTAAVIQAANGLTSFDSTQFTTTNGWAQIKTNGLTIDRLATMAQYTLVGNMDTPSLSSPVAVTAKKVVEKAIESSISPATVSSGAVIRTSSETFNTIAVSTSATASTIVQRDISSNITTSSLISSSGLIDTTGTNNPLRIVNPGGGAWTGTAATQTGAIKIKFPTNITTAPGYSSHMIRMTVKIFDFNGGVSPANSRTIEIAGYNYYQTNSWAACSAYQTSGVGAELNVRFGNDTSGNCIWIGETSSTWSWPSVYITEVQVGYPVFPIEYAKWSSGWVISFAQSFDTVSFSGGLSSLPISRSWNSVSNNLPAANNTYNIGSATYSMANVYSTNFIGTATQAKYADLAENYAADKQYDVGTVLMIGGEYEVTIANEAGTTKVIGIVSDKPAYLMNSEITAEFPVAIALQGRVPCKVVGKVSKGDMLVAGIVPGVAMSDNNPQTGRVIGKALENYDSDRIGIIEVVVGKH